MLTPIQQRKLSYLSSLYDADKDGALERTVYERIADCTECTIAFER